MKVTFTAVAVIVVTKTNYVGLLAAKDGENI